MSKKRHNRSVERAHHAKKRTRPRPEPALDAVDANVPNPASPPRRRRAVIEILSGATIGAAFGMFVPGVINRGPVWAIAGAILGAAAVTGVKGMRLLQRRLGAISGVAAFILVVTGAVTVIGASPAGCHPCTVPELQGWVGAGLSGGMLVAIVTMVSTTGGFLGRLALRTALASRDAFTRHTGRDRQVKDK